MRGIGSILVLAITALVASGCSVGGSHSTSPPCITSKAVRPNTIGATVGGIAPGPGPAYPDFDVFPAVTLTNAERIGIVHYGTAMFHGYHYAKTLWLTSPHTNYTIVVSGHEVGNLNKRVRFDVDDHVHVRPTLRIHGGSRWLYGSSATLLPEAGCYDLRVQLPARAYTVTVRAGP